MAWIDYKKAYDMVPHSWIIECLDLFAVAEIMLCSRNSELGEVEIK